MRLTFWGVRGSFPVARPHVRRFGGNTPCVQIEAEGHHLVIDAGTGIRRLGRKLIREGAYSNPIYILISHTHWDHIQGFPFFAPAYSSDYRLFVGSVERPSPSLRELFSHQQDVNFFPVPLAELQSDLKFLQFEEGIPYELGPFKVACYRLNHPGITAGYRIEYKGLVVAYISDVAPSRHMLLADNMGEGTEQEHLARLYRNQVLLASEADLVIYDTFFTPEQYAERKHWGHSTAEDAVALCREAGVGHLFLFHHNPDCCDDELAVRLEGYKRAYEADGFKISASAEGCSYMVEEGGGALCG